MKKERLQFNTTWLAFLIPLGMGVHALASLTLFELKSGMPLPLGQASTWVELFVATPIISSVLAAVLLLPVILLMIFIKPLRRAPVSLPLLAAGSGALLLVVDAYLPEAQLHDAADELFQDLGGYSEAGFSSSLNVLGIAASLAGLAIFTAVKSFTDFIRNKEARSEFNRWAGLVGGLQIVFASGAVACLCVWGAAVVKDVQFISVLRDLQTGQPAERARAAKIFRETGDHRIVRHLSKALREDDDPKVRLEAVQALAKLAGRQDLRGMLKTLSDPDPKVAQAALEALSTYQTGNDLSESERRDWARKLVKLLKGDNAQGRLYAAELLMALGQEASSQVTPLLREKDETAQLALDILAQVGDENAIAHLLYHLELPKADTILAAITRRVGVRALVGRAFANAAPVWRKTKTQVTRIVQEIGVPAVEPLTEAVCDEGLSTDGRTFAFQMVAELGGAAASDRAATRLVQTLASQDRRTRERTRYVLRKIRKPAVWALIDGLSASDENIRTESAAVLRGITRRRFGDKPDRWKTWWNSKQPRIVEQPVP